MLAQNFKSPADLGITDAEFNALLTVLGMLERGELRHVSFNGSGAPNGFNMGVWDCGTAACIGGWVERVAKISLRLDLPPALERLFYPAEMNSDKLFAKMTDGAAALALRSFLTTGEANWAEALA